MEEPETHSFFVKYEEVVLECYNDKDKYWMAFNEINNQKNYFYPLFGYNNFGVIYKDEANPENACIRRCIINWLPVL